MTKTLCLVSLAASACVLAPGALPAQTPGTPLPVAEITRIEAQEFARALAQLKVQEVALQRAVPADEKAVELNRAQQATLEQELTKLAAAPINAEIQRLEAERDDLAKDLTPRHPKMLALQAAIDKARASLAANR